MKWANENSFDPQVIGASKVWNVPVSLLKAVIAQESAFNPRAVRNEAPRDSLPPTPDFPAGGDQSRGLMQLLVRTARALGYQGPPDGLYDPALNIALGAQLLRQNLDRAGGAVDVALSAYNGGWSSVRPNDGKRVSNTLPSLFINQNYVDRVLAFERYFREGTSGPPAVQSGGGGGGGLVLPGGITFYPNLLTILLVGLLLAALAGNARGARA
jgi:soluble lytic murein transglycosylase-like protein